MAAPAPDSAPRKQRSLSSNTSWRAVGSGIRYLTYILLSIILGTEEMGRMALALIVVEVLDSLKGAGIGQFVIERSEIGSEVLHSIATLQLLVVSVLVTAILTGAYAWAASRSIGWVPVAESGVMLALAFPTFVIPFCLVRMKFRDLVHAIRTPLFISLSMAAVVCAGMRWMTDMQIGPWPSLIAGTACGVTIYLCLTLAFARPMLLDVWTAVTQRPRTSRA